MATKQILDNFFGLVLDDGSINITPGTTANDMDGCDSLSHVNLITAIESTFKVRFTQKKLFKLRNVSDFINDIDRKMSL